MIEKTNKWDTKGIDPTLGNRIRAARKEHGWSIKELSEMVGCSTTHLTRLELAKRRIGSEKLLKSFSEKLNIPYDELCNLAGPDFSAEMPPLLRQAFPSLATDQQEDAVTKFAMLVAGGGLTNTQIAHLLEQCKAYVEYCKRQNEKV